MQVKSVAIWAGLGMVLSSAVATAVPVPRVAAVSPTVTITPPIRSEPPVDASHFTAGQTLTVDGRLGHSTLARSSSGETFLFASVAGTDAAGVEAPPLNLAIVIDRSGSMKGDRIANAIAAAVGTIDRMRDGDTVSVVSFDTEAQVVVPPTEVGLTSRGSIQASIRAIRLGGDTCISCGLDEAMAALDRAREPGTAQRDRVNRMMLLSDGVTNHGIKDIPGLRAMASRMRDRGFSISTIGVDVDFDEKVMAAIAQESNGRHYFVSNASGLSSIFAQEFDSLVTTVARDSELVVELAPGVEVDQVFDRAFRRQGSKIVIPFGSFSAKQEKTVLMKLHVPADQDGARPVANVKLAYRDLVKRVDGTCEGKLAVNVLSDGSEQKDMDPFVAARLARSRTSRTLTDANLLFEQGRAEDARGLLLRQGAELRRDAVAAKAAKPMAPAPSRARALDDDFGTQIAAVAEAEKKFAPPPPSVTGGMGGGEGRRGPASQAAAPKADSRPGKDAVRTNQERASDFQF